MSQANRITDIAEKSWLVFKSLRYFDGTLGQKMLDAVPKFVEGASIALLLTGWKLRSSTVWVYRG